MNRKKILLAYITKNSGHHQAVLAIERNLDRLNCLGEIKTKSVNFSKHIHPLISFFGEKIYLWVLQDNSQIWERVYDNPRVYTWLVKWIDCLVFFKFWKLRGLIEGFVPDVICCTQAFPALIMANFKKRAAKNSKIVSTPIVGVLTDYSPHWYWVHADIDLYVVPSAEIAEILISRGVKQEKIRVLGIPIDPKFFVERVDKKAVLKKMGLEESRPVILLMGGSKGLGPIREIVIGLSDRFHSSLQLIVVCGRNLRLKKEIQKEIEFSRCPIKVLGYIENINELMEISSLIITKPGGQTVSESLTCGLPMILINPIPGQEILNARFLVKRGMAILVGAKEAIEVVGYWFENPEIREKWRLKAKTFVKPDAALVIAEILIKGWN